MQFTIAGLLAVASLASAQYAGIPTCAQSCIADAVQKSTTCGATDTTCQCLPDNVSKIQNAATSCVIDACGITVALTVQSAATSACASLPASSASAQTSASSVPSSSAVAPSSSAAVLPSSSAVAPSSSVAEASPVVSSAASTPVSSAVLTPITSGVAAPTGSIGSNATAPSTPTSSITPYTGAGAQVRAGLGSALVLGVAAIFAF
ncbi:hypothetical protein EAF04_000703 [Stromatinia cepivora]|nr:hypothetical protein EAF04_000703 [Stromatinia cepivora]